MSASVILRRHDEGSASRPDHGVTDPSQAQDDIDPGKKVDIPPAKPLMRRLWRKWFQLRLLLVDRRK